MRSRVISLQIKASSALFCVMTACVPAAPKTENHHEFVGETPFQETSETSPLQATASKPNLIEQCEVGSTVYFSCNTTKGGVILICGKQITPLSRSVAYYHQTTDGQAFEHRWAGDQGENGAFKKNVYSRYETEYIEISFTIGSEEHRTYRRYDARRDPEPTLYGTEVVDAETGEELASIECNSTQVDQLKELSAILACDESSALGCFR